MQALNANFVPVRDWLNGLPNCANAEIVILTLERTKTTTEMLKAVRYDRVRQYMPNERAVEWGWGEAGADYLTTFLYILGVVPKWAEKGKTVYTQFDDEWYLSGYSPKVIEEQYKQYHPFGQFWQLTKHFVHPRGPYAGHRIDTLEPKAYQRVPLSEVIQ